MIHRRDLDPPGAEPRRPSRTSPILSPRAKRRGREGDNLRPMLRDPITPAMSDTAPSKRLFIKTYGCQMNVYDSERMADVPSPLAYGITDPPGGTALVVLNTCHIREKATEKVYSELGKLK